ncbi:hypothetical protein T03_6831 [Trichinella britovi]|uniref:Uncharacterized protein n=1 Tax=Trichinella britovi TaxID=45882 RepID=A0A0V0Z0H2_TRIBR|nr:hypothetical protein T03_6831 [Trichinella britovi]
MKQEKDDDTQHLEAFEWPYEPLGVLDASAAVAWTSTDVTPPATRLKTNGGEKSDGDHQPADR